MVTVEGNQPAMNPARNCLTLCGQFSTEFATRGTGIERAK